ncbi:MAG: ADP-ribosylglycohydrolase family protein [Vicinamibacterales bacterium]
MAVSQSQVAELVNRRHLADRARHALLAGALGDAWGGPYENRPSSGRACFPERPSFSDDTLLTVATCEALVETGGQVEPAQLAATFRQWFEARRFSGLGAATLKALRDLAAGGHWALAGARGEFAAGAGAAMRIAPFAFVIDPAQDRARTLLRDVSRITHHSEEAYAGALAVAVAVRHCAHRMGVPVELPRLVADQLPDTRVRDRLNALAAFGGNAGEAAAQFGSSGYVVDAVPMALFVASRSAHLGIQSVAEEAASLGGDTDTIASIASQVTGASGYEPPRVLLERTSGFDDVEARIEQFAALLNQGPG